MLWGFFKLKLKTISTQAKLWIEISNKTIHFRNDLGIKSTKFRYYFVKKYIASILKLETLIIYLKLSNTILSALLLVELMTGEKPLK